MRISEIHLYTKNLPIVDGPYTMAGTELHAVDTTILKMVTDTGLIGWGESCPLGPNYQAEHSLGVQAALRHLAPKLIGEAVDTQLLLRRKIDSLLMAHNSAKSALDIAIHDLRAKHYGIRVCDLLGGAETELLPSYYAIGINDPDETARIALEKVAQGYHRLQLKVGGREVEEDIAAIHKVWEAFASKTGKQVQIIIDANRGLSTRDAILISQQCRDISMTIEQPCNTLEEIKVIRNKLLHPLFIDENSVDIQTVMQCISQDYCDGFGLKVSRLGGLSQFALARDLCEVRNMPISCDDTFGGDIIAAACVHGGATVKPKLFEGSWIAATYIAEHYDSRNPIEVNNGLIQLPKGVGLGIEPDENKIGELLESFV